MLTWNGVIESYPGERECEVRIEFSLLEREPAFLNILINVKFLLLRPEGLSFVTLGSIAFCLRH